MADEEDHTGVYMRLPILALIGVAVVLQTGCVTGRRSLSLPVSTHEVPSTSRGQVYLLPPERGCVGALAFDQGSERFRCGADARQGGSSARERLLSAGLSCQRGNDPCDWISLEWSVSNYA
jgi:hypothetical protein